MKRGLYYLFSTLVVLSMLLGACTTAAPTTEAPAPPTEAPEPTKAPPPTEAPEPTEPPAPAEASADDLDAAFGGLLAGMKAYNTNKADGLLEAMVEDQPPFILDVRTTAEVEENGHIEGAVNIPLNELAQKLELLPAFDVPVVAYCGSGWRATIAMTALSALGWEDVKALKTTFADWKEAGNPVVEGPAEEAPALNAAEPNPGLVAVLDEMLSIYGVKPFGVIDAEGLNIALVESPDLVIDVRRAEELEEKGVIDTGDVELIHISLEEFIDSRDMWPQTDASIAVYCGSGHRSTMAMTILGAYGYQDVTSLKGGFGGWAEAGYPTVGGEVSVEAKLDEGFAALLAGMQVYNTIKADGLMEAMVEDQPPFILDVRTTAEVEENGHIEGAVNIPLNELAQNLDLLPAFDVPVVAYCGSGWRATIAMTALSALGWEDVKALKTTFADWKEAGNPVVEGPAEEASALNAAEPDPDMVDVIDEALQAYGVKPFGVIDAEGLNTALVENPELVVIDVRRTEEVAEKGVIDTGEAELILIPLEEFIAQQEIWPETGESIVVYCGSGHRSTMAMTILWTYGYEDVTSLKGGFTSWEEAGYPVAEYVAQ